MSEREWEGTELLNNLVKGLLGAVTLETVGEGGTAMEGSSLLKVLELTGAERDTDLNAPNLGDLWEAITLSLLSWCEDNLLLALNLVALEQPRGGVFDKVAVVGLDDLLEHLGHLGLGDGLLLLGLGLLLDGAGSQQSSWDHESQQELVGVVSSEHQISDAGLVLLGLSWDNDGVADNRSEAINLGTKLDLDNIAGLESDGGLGLIRLEWGIWGNESIWRDSGWVRDAWNMSVDLVSVCQMLGQHTLGDLLSSVNLCNLLLEDLVSLLADVYDLLTSNAELGDGLEDLVRDGASILVLGKGIWVGESVI